MLANKKIKFLSLILSSVMLVSMVAGCTKAPSGDNQSGTQTSEKLDPNQKLIWNINSDPKTLDPSLNSATDGSTVIRTTFEGLTKLDENNKVVPGVAEALPTVSADGLTYTFKIRKDAKWSDGVPVKAQDFVFAYLRGLDPKTAAEYQIELFNLKNGKEYAAGKAKAEDVGVKAADDNTLVITLANPTAYFPELLANSIYMPQRKDVVEKSQGDAWSRDPKTYIGNGPFKMKEWSAKDKIVLVKNDNYWNAKEVKLNEITFKMIEDASTALASFRNGEIDYTESPPAAEIKSLVDEGTGKILPYIGTYYLDFNMTPQMEKLNPAGFKAIQDPRIRKALVLAINRKQLVDNVTKGGQLPATGFVPVGINDADGKDFAGKKTYIKDNDIDTAKKLLADAGYPDGKGFPKLEFRYNTSEGHKNIAEAVQGMWKKNLGIDIDIKNEEWKVFQVSRTNKQTQIARDGWIGDYMDPNTFLELLVSNNGNNNPGYNNPKYDDKVNSAKKEVDPAKRMALLHDAEAILMDDMPVIPLYFYTNVVAIKPYVKGYHKAPTGAVYFEKIYLTEKK